MSAVFFFSTTPHYIFFELGAHCLGQMCSIQSSGYSCRLAKPAFLPLCWGSATVNTTLRANVVFRWNP